MPIDTGTGIIAHAIQLAIAPVFVLPSLRWMTGVLFVAAMLAHIGGRGSFLREVYLATHTITFDLTHLRD